MNKTKTNIAANFIGRVMAAILNIIFVPIYLRYLGVEIYGIIGFFTSIQAFLLLFDGGISPTLNREVARLTVFPEKAQELRDLSRTLEILCWAAGIFVCVFALVLSPTAAIYWLKSDNIPINLVSNALMLMSVTFVFQWATTFYTGGLYGLQEQKTLNLVNTAIAILRAFGALYVLAYVSATISAFLIWQFLTTLLNCFLLAIFFWRKLPYTGRQSTFRKALLKEVWHYAAGMAGISLTVLVLTQTDKIILSKILILKDFGYYTLAITLAGAGLGLIIGSIQTTYFPQFSQMVAQKKLDELRPLYHRACQVMSLFLIPTTGILAFFSYDIMLIWSGNGEIAQNTYLLLMLVAIGTGLNGLMHLPYYTQLAFGITKIAFWQNIVAIIILIPFMIYASLHYGAVGGAVCLVIVNFSYTIIGMQVMNRMILKGELKTWYLRDSLAPIIVVSTILLIGKNLFDLTNASIIYKILIIGGLYVAATFTLIFTLRHIRESFLYYWKRTLTRLNFGV